MAVSRTKTHGPSSLIYPYLTDHCIEKCSSCFWRKSCSKV